MLYVYKRTSVGRSYIPKEKNPLKVVKHPYRVLCRVKHASKVYRGKIIILNYKVKTKLSRKLLSLFKSIPLLIY
jgi:hypothetical protein